jgi:Rrf2 family protein
MAGSQIFSQRFGYAAHALAYMSKKAFGELTTLPELAGWMRSVWPHASETYLSNVIQRLARGGIVRSHRGIAGGYSLGRPAKDINLRHIREVLDGVTLEKCALSLGPECPAQETCTIQRTLCKLEEQYMKSLEKFTIAQIAAQMPIALVGDVSVGAD